MAEFCEILSHCVRYGIYVSGDLILSDILDGGGVI